MMNWFYNEFIVAVYQLTQQMVSPSAILCEYFLIDWDIHLILQFL